MSKEVQERLMGKSGGAQTRLCSTNHHGSHRPATDLRSHSRLSSISKYCINFMTIAPKNLPKITSAEKILK